MKPLDLSGIPNRRDLLAEARRLGCTVQTMNGGEVRVSHPALDYRVNCNNRRKDGNRALVGMLRRLQEMS